MKTVVKCYSEDFGKTVDIDFLTDKHISNDFFLVTDIEKVKSNIENFKIKKQLAKTDKDIGVSFAKKQSHVIVTFNILQGNCSFLGQFLIGNKSKFIEAKSNDLIRGFEEIIIQAYNVLNTNTLGDLVND
jgi:5'-3' exonuclease